MKLTLLRGDSCIKQNETKSPCNGPTCSHALRDSHTWDVHRHPRPRGPRALSPVEALGDRQGWGCWHRHTAAGSHLEHPGYGPVWLHRGHCSFWQPWPLQVGPPPQILKKSFTSSGETRQVFCWNNYAEGTFGKPFFQGNTSDVSGPLFLQSSFLLPKTFYQMH